MLSEYGNGQISSLIPLSEVASGEKVLVEHLDGGKAFRTRMAAMGIAQGREALVIQNYYKGPMIIQIGDTRIAVGRGEAQKILVKIIYNQ